MYRSVTHFENDSSSDGGPGFDLGPDFGAVVKTHIDSHLTQSKSADRALQVWCRKGNPLRSFVSGFSEEPCSSLVTDRGRMRRGFAHFGHVRASATLTAHGILTPSELLTSDTSAISRQRLTLPPPRPHTHTHTAVRGKPAGLQCVTETRQLQAYLEGSSRTSAHVALPTSLQRITAAIALIAEHNERTGICLGDIEAETC
ncbi:hypothetical protein Q8A73_004112 [Channa argus]|nr:hypothetical protein Q8A73_004112 [Channa argus]